MRVQTGRPRTTEFFPGKSGLLLGQGGLESRLGGGHTQCQSDRKGVILCICVTFRSGFVFNSKV